MVSTQDILGFFSGERGRPVKRRELAKELQVSDRAYPAFRAQIQELLRSGRLVKLKRGRLAPPDPLNLVVGIIGFRPQGYAFVRVEDRADLPQVFIRAPRTKTALDGDRVMVRLLHRREGPTPEGEVIRVIERRGKPIIGIFGKTKFVNYVRPDPPVPFREVYIYPDKTEGAEPGQQVLVRIDDWPAADLTPEGCVTKVLGYPDEPGVDVQRVIHEYNLPGVFPKSVMSETRKLPTDIPETEIARRVDLRDTFTLTIDPKDAKDFDDAVSIEETPDGWRIGVHIADVTHYVEPKTNLDREAYLRGTSVYLVDRVIPMLPTRLSNNLCSLKPKVDRLTMSCVADVSRNGVIKKFNLSNSIIHSRARLNYQQVQNFFETGERGRIPPGAIEHLTIMRLAAEALRSQRFKLGSLNLEMPEVRVKLDEAGEPIEFVREMGNEAHWLIEEFMLMANKCVAVHFLRENAPILYRVHAKPDQEKIEEFATFLKTMGYPFSAKGTVTTKRLARLLDRLDGDPRRPTIEMMLLRSLKRAEYSPDNVGHFGLGFSHYCHFTSPIRRYPDLWVHRHLKKILARSWSAKEKQKAAQELPVVGRWISDRERIAQEAERESVLVKQLQYLNEHLGDEFTGTITGFLDFGFFVQVDSVWVDGLVRFSGIDDDYYRYDSDQHRVVGRRTHKSYSLGERVKVRLIKVNNVKREVDLIMADAPLERETRQRWRRGRRRYRRKR